MADSVFSAISEQLPTQGSSLVSAIKGDVLFMIDGKPFHLALTENAKLTKSENPADVTVSLSEADFLSLCAGERDRFRAPLLH